MAATSDMPRLTTFQHHIDDMRNLVMCKICLKPLYEPFILACGHTYCYGCLRSWFTGLDSRKRRKNCPDCRADVKLTPSPNYILRDLVHMFIGRAELLPEDETVDEHLAGKLVESELLANDKEGVGLFKGVFKIKVHTLADFGPLHDISDGVFRCPHCHWEIEDGECPECGYLVDEDDYPDFSDEEGDDSMMGDDDSIGSDDMSDGSGHGSVHGLGHHFYGAHSAVGHIDHSMGSDIYSDISYSTPNPYTGRETDDDDDDDEMDGFINDHNDNDEPDEIDEDDVDGLPQRYMPHPRGRTYRVLDDDEDHSGEDEDEEGRQYNWHTAGPINIDDSSDNEEAALTENEDETGDQQTVYDESEEESRSSTPVVMPIVPRRRLLVISDDDDEDIEEDEEQEVADSHTEGRSRSEDLESDSHVSSGSDDTATPPQPSAYRRQRLDVHRKRRQTPDAWRTIARGRERPVSRRESRAETGEVRRLGPRVIS